MPDAGRPTLFDLAAAVSLDQFRRAVNEAEVRLAFLDRAGLPRPAKNMPRWLGDRFIEADCVWQEQRVIVELDGYATHGTRAAYVSDRARDRGLAVHGRRVVRVTWGQLPDQPEAVARDLRALLTPQAAPRPR